MGKPAHITTAEAIAALRDTSNREMARRYGACPSTWARIRKRHGIDNVRQPTTVGGVPAPWATPQPAKADAPVMFKSYWRAPDPQRDCSLAGEAASFLRRERFHVFDRAKVGVGEGWQVGRSVLSAADMLAKATRLGFRPQAWMGGL